MYGFIGHPKPLQVVPGVGQAFEWSNESAICDVDKDRLCSTFERQVGAVGGRMVYSRCFNPRLSSRNDGLDGMQDTTSVVPVYSEKTKGVIRSQLQGKWNCEEALPTLICSTS